MIRGAFYARVSTEHQEKEKTIDSQLEALMSRAAELGWVVPQDLVFRDDGFSGTRLDRPGLDSMRDAASEGRFASLLVYDADRLARNFVHQEILIEDLERHGISIEFIERSLSKKPEDRLLSQVKGIFAEYERTKILERTRRGKLHKAKTEGWVNWSVPPYGYSVTRSGGDTRVQINEKEAAWIRQMYSWVIDDGISGEKCARRLQQLGIPTRRGGRWMTCTVRNILVNPLYTGSAYYNRREAVEPKRRRDPGRYPRQLKSGHRIRPEEQWIHIPIPALVTEEDQRRAREMLSSHKLNSPRKTKYEYLLRTLVVCGECHLRMGCISISNSRKDLRYPYYRCKKTPEETGRAEKCSAKNVRADWLDEAVWNSVKEWLNEPDILRAELESITNTPDSSFNTVVTEWNRLDSLISSYGKQMERITDAYQMGAITVDDLRERRKALDGKASEAIKRKQEISSLRDRHMNTERLLSDIDAFASRLKEGLDTLSFDERQKVMRLLVERVVVKGDSVQIEHVIPIKGRFSSLNINGRDYAQGDQTGLR